MGDQTFSKKIVSFDLNGTYIADMHVWYAAVCDTFEFCRLRAPSANEYLSDVSRYGAFGELFLPQYVDVSSEELETLYTKSYLGRIDLIRPAPGALEVVRELREHGIVCSILSAQRDEIFNALAESFDLHSLFDFVEHAIADKAVRMQELCTKRNIPPSSFFYVGDLLGDVRAAHEAGVRSVAYINGYIPRDLFENEGSHYIIEDMSDLISIVRGQ